MPRKLTAKQESLRQQCYDAGLTDKEIANICGVSRKIITCWRNQRHLPINPGLPTTPAPCNTQKPKGLPKKISSASFRKALPPEKHDAMLKFLWAFTKFAEQKDKIKSVSTFLDDYCKYVGYN